MHFQFAIDTKSFAKVILIVAPLFLTMECSLKRNQARQVTDSILQIEMLPEKVDFIKVENDITIKKYFSFMDSLSCHYDTIHHKELNEYAIIHSNPWILDSLRSWDYYTSRSNGKFLYDQSKMVILHKGDSLTIPDSTSTAKIIAKLKSTVIDINIPEYTLRLIQSGDTILTCPVRVGRNAKKYLVLAGHIVDLKTPTGEGEIVRIERNPVFINPDTGERYDSTFRDDGRYTKLPIIPWLEPIINGVRYGDLIHPTTNIQTLRRAYSHGCIGTSEADAWTIYYNSPIGTKVIFRYDLTVVNHGDTVLLNDIYALGEKR